MVKYMNLTENFVRKYDTGMQMYLTNGTGRPCPAAKTLTAVVHTVSYRRLADAPILAGVAVTWIHSCRINGEKCTHELEKEN